MLEIVLPWGQTNNLDIPQLDNLESQPSRNLLCGQHPCSWNMNLFPTESGRQYPGRQHAKHTNWEWLHLQQSNSDVEILLYIQGLFWCNLLHVFYFILLLHHLVCWMKQVHEAVRFFRYFSWIPDPWIVGDLSGLFQPKQFCVFQVHNSKLWGHRREPIEITLVSSPRKAAHYT